MIGAAAFGAALMWLVPTANAAESDPALTTPVGRLESALRCPGDLSLARQPVLLVHGTGADHSDWTGNYEQLLPAAGFDVCTVDLPAFAMDDVQVASEYVVHAIRRMAAASGQQVDVIGHSQGALEPRWVIRWWPGVASLVDDHVSLAGVHHGTTLADSLCSGLLCAPAVWQMRPGSAFLAALNEGDETPAGPSWTSLYSADDGVVVPAESSVLDGASNVRVQDLCPGRSVDHNRMRVDAVVFALVLDALGHPGPADPARVDPSVCAQDLAADAAPPPDDAAQVLGTGMFLQRVLTAAPLLADEPPLAFYVGAAAPSEQPTPDAGAPATTGVALAGPSSAASTGALPATGGGVTALGPLLVLAAILLRNVDLAADRAAKA